MNQTKQDLRKNMKKNPNLIPQWKKDNTEKVVLDYIKEECRLCSKYSKMNVNGEEFHVCNDGQFLEVGYFIITEFSVVACKMIKELGGNK